MSQDPYSRGGRPLDLALILAVYTQLRLARTPAAATPGRNRVPRTDSLLPASAATFGTSAHRPPSRPEHRNPARPGTGRPPGQKNTWPTPRHDEHTSGKRHSPKTAKDEGNYPTTTPHKLKIKLGFVLPDSHQDADTVPGVLMKTRPTTPPC